MFNVLLKSFLLNKENVMFITPMLIKFKREKILPLQLLLLLLLLIIVTTIITTLLVMLLNNNKLTTRHVCVCVL